MEYTIKFEHLDRTNPLKNWALEDDLVGALRDVFDRHEELRCVTLLDPRGEVIKRIANTLKTRITVTIDVDLVHDENVSMEKLRSWVEDELDILEQLDGDTEQIQVANVDYLIKENRD